MAGTAEPAKVGPVEDILGHPIPDPTTDPNGFTDAIRSVAYELVMQYKANAPWNGVDFDQFGDGLERFPLGLNRGFPKGRKGQSLAG
jgi:hypothetical protein